VFPVQQTGQITTAVGKKQGLFFICCFVLHGDVAVLINTGLCAAAGRLPAPQSSGQRHRTFQQNQGGEESVFTSTAVGATM